MAACRSVVVLLVFGVLLLLIVPAALAAPNSVISDPLAEPSWTVEVNGPAVDSNDSAVDAKLARGGATWVCGNVQTASGMYDISLTKIVDGVKQWTKSWDSPFHRNDMAAQMALGPNGVMYTAGWSSNVHYADMILLKWSSSGVLKWVRRYDGPGHKSDFGRLVGVDRAGNVTISGTTDTNNQGEELVARSYTAGGRVGWTWMYNDGPFQVLPGDQCVLSDGTVHLTGQDYLVIRHRLTSMALCIRLSPSGKRVWLRHYAGPDGLGAGSQAIAKCPSGGVYIAGSTKTAVDAVDGLVMRSSATGKRTVFALGPGGGGHSEYFNDITVTSNDRIVAVGGASDAVGTTYPGPVTIYTAAGRIASNMTWPGPGAAQFNAVAADSSGGFSVFGSASPLLAVLWGSTLASGEGWTALYGAPASNASGSAIAVRENTTVVAGNVLSGTPSESCNQVALGWVD
jgi:hypothetical protein